MIFFSVKLFGEGKLVYGENLSPVKVNRWGKKIVAEKYSSLFPDEVFSDKVPDDLILCNTNNGTEQLNEYLKCELDEYKNCSLSEFKKLTVNTLS